MQFLNLQILIIAWLLNSLGRCQSCSYLYPEYIRCSLNATNIIKGLNLVRSGLNDNQTNFDQFTLNTDIEELPNDMFQDFTFKRIQINSAINLRHINSNSFNGTTEVTEIYNHYPLFPTKLVNNPPDYNLYLALSSLVNVRSISINLEWNRSHEIPDYAFSKINGKQNKLNTITFNGQFGISRIGNYAFYQIANLSKIDFYSVSVQFISAHAFDFEDSFYNKLIINLTHSELTEKSFETGVFTNSKRQLEVYLGQNNIRYIENRVFGDFFKINEVNIVDISDNPLNCNDIDQFEWLLKGKSILKDRLIGAKCSNGSRFWDLSYVQNDTIQWLDDLSNRTIQDVSDAIDSVQSISKEMESHDTLSTSEDIKKLMTFMDKLHDFVKKNKTNIDLNTASNLTTNSLIVLSHLINQNKAWNNSTDSEKTEMASLILLHAQYTSFMLSCKLDDVNRTHQVSSDNLIMKAFHVNTSHELFFERNGSSIVVPAGMEMDGDSECNNSASGAIIKQLNNYLLADLSDQQRINTEILAFSIANSNETHAIKNGGKVRIRLKHNNRLMFGDKIKCVYWDFLSSKWSSNGCDLVTDHSNRDLSVCECNHLTNFAALLDISGQEDNSLAKSILTYICCSLSVICLILTILLTLKRKTKSTTYNLSTSELIKTRDVITYNLCFCLIIANLLVIFGMDRTEIKWLCELLSGVLLYSLLCSFSWMLIEGYNLYRMTSQVFDILDKRIRLAIIAYGTPILICLVALTIVWLNEHIFFDALIGEYFCWVSSEKHPNHIWIFLGPALSAILINSVIMSLLFREVYRLNIRNKKNSRHVSKLKQIFSFTSLVFNLGLTWLLFILYIHKLGIYYSYFSYVFIVLNGSQGVFIFIYNLAIYLNQNSRKIIPQQSHNLRF